MNSAKQTHVANSRFFTAWGRAVNSSMLGYGVRVVRTKDGGGFVFGEGNARKLLSSAAITRAEPYGRYLCYSFAGERWVIPLFEMPAHWTVMLPRVADPRAKLIQTLSRHHADYLLDRGIEPEPKALALWKRDQAYRVRLGQMDPDLIINARSVAPGMVEVITADGRTHVVTEASFDRQGQHGSLFLLSRCRCATPRHANA